MNDYLITDRQRVFAWAEKYFSDEEHLDVYIPLRDLADKFRAETGCEKITTNGFRRRLTEFVESCPYIYAINPYELCTVKPDKGKQNGRILRRPLDKDNHPTYYTAVDHIYMQSRKMNYNDPHVITEGQWVFELNDEITEEELKYLIPVNIRCGVDQLHWYSVKWIGRCRDGNIFRRYSTKDYPIFMRECRYIEDGEKKRFFRMFEPCHPRKDFRHRFFGKKPENYVNGLYELKELYDRENEHLRRCWNRNPSNAGKPFEERKLPVVFICNDQILALWFSSVGYTMLWMDSEVAEFHPSKLEEARNFAKNFYFLPKWIHENPIEYIQREGIKPVLSDSEESD